MAAGRKPIIRTTLANEDGQPPAARTFEAQLDDGRWMHISERRTKDGGYVSVGGDLARARAVTARLRQLAEEQDHPWGRVTARRCASLTALALAYDEAAATALEHAADEYTRLGLRFDAARSLIALGREQRRSRKWGAARSTLQRAEAAFEELRSPGWAEAARSELARVGARRPSPAGELTPTERRVAELAAQGLANKEIARALVVSVSTVEFHLSNIYAKLGVRSRTQLAARLAAPTEPAH